MKHIRSILSTAATVAFVALVGCSHAANGNGTATNSDASASGSATTGQAVDTSKLGAPVYPGAQVTGAGSAAAMAEMGSNAALFHTTDTFDQVVAFYEQKLPPKSERMKMSSGGSSLASFQFIANDGKTGTQVTITAKAGQTRVLIATAPVKK